MVPQPRSALRLSVTPARCASSARPSGLRSRGAPHRCQPTRVPRDMAGGAQPRDLAAIVGQRPPLDPRPIGDVNRMILALPSPLREGQGRGWQWRRPRRVVDLAAHRELAAPDLASLLRPTALSVCPRRSRRLKECSPEVCPCRSRRLERCRPEVCPRRSPRLERCSPEVCPRRSRRLERCSPEVCPRRSRLKETAAPPSSKLPRVTAMLSWPPLSQIERSSIPRICACVSSRTGPRERRSSLCCREQPCAALPTRSINSRRRLMSASLGTGIIMAQGRPLQGSGLPPKATVWRTCSRPPGCMQC
jgi:hypothetical protein